MNGEAIGRAQASAHRVGERGPRAAGPLLVTVGGIHGNEPAGVEASRRVLEALARDGLALGGRFVALAGNLGGLAASRRFLDADLNRIWSSERVARLRRGGAPVAREEAEMLGLLAAIEEEIAGSPLRRAVVLDLHSTSADGSPFTVMSDTLRNRAIALALPVPVILGLEEAIEGSMLDYLGERGHVVVGIEGGSHDDPRTVDHHESAIWITLVAAGLLPRAAVPAPGLAEHRERLRRSARSLPAVVEVVHRHGTDVGDGFAMEPGFANFRFVRRGTLLARDRDGELRAGRRGLVLLPRYQGQGNDGFFLGRRVRMTWLRVSGLLRRVGADRLLPILPGVRRAPGEAAILLADPRVARWAVVKVFHLLGYRRTQVRGRHVTFTRRD